MIKGSLILLAATVAAVIWHNVDFVPGNPASYNKINISNETLFPEQKFLISGPFDINKATAEELEAIPRIGPSLAMRIIEYRKQRGQILNIEELLEVKGIGLRNIENIKPFIMVLDGR